MFVALLYISWVYFVLETPNDAHGLLLSLHSGITPDDALGHICNAKYQTGLGTCKAKVQIFCTIVPATTNALF